MKAWGVTIEEVQAAVRVASIAYEGNIVFKREAEKYGKAVRFTLTVKNSKKRGGRISPNGRRVCAACWHLHRDVMKAVFAVNPDARIKTAMADYKGLDDFNATYPATGRVNIGSQMYPLYAKDACCCEGCNDN